MYLAGKSPVPLASRRLTVVLSEKRVRELKDFHRQIAAASTEKLTVQEAVESELYT